MATLREKLSIIKQFCEEAEADLDNLASVFSGVPSSPVIPQPNPNHQRDSEVSGSAEVKPIPTIDSHGPNNIITGVYASVWGDRSDEEAGNWERLYYPQFKCLPRGGIDNAWVSLPAVVPAGTEVWLQHSKKDGTALGEWVGPFAVVDLGPWYDGTDGKTKRPEWFDPYWITNTRPKVETEELDPRGRKDNGAGIDLTPATMALVKSGDAESIWERPTSAYVNVRVIEPANSENSGLISPHFSWTEFTFSDTANRLGINNTITESAKENVKDLVKYLLEPLRSWVRGPITLSSGYRSEELDAAIHEANGTAQSKDKEHTQGYACDIVFGKDKTLIEIFDYIKTNLEFDRIIWEDSHIHISFKKAKNRKLVVRSP